MTKKLNASWWIFQVTLLPTLYKRMGTRQNATSTLYFCPGAQYRVKVKVSEGKSAEEVTAAATHQTNLSSKCNVQTAQHTSQKANIQLHEVALSPEEEV